MELTTSTRMSYASAWCDEVSKARDAMDSARMSYDAMSEAMDGIQGVRYDRDGGSPTMEHGDDAMMAKLERISDSRARMEQASLDYGESVAEFSMSLERMGNATYSKLLAMRYVKGWHWNDIAYAMNYSESHVRGYMHVAALIDLYDVMPERRKLPTAI